MAANLFSFLKLALQMIENTKVTIKTISRLAIMAVMAIYGRLVSAILLSYSAAQWSPLRSNSCTDDCV